MHRVRLERREASVLDDLNGYRVTFDLNAINDGRRIVEKLLDRGNNAIGHVTAIGHSNADTRVRQPVALRACVNSAQLRDVGGLVCRAGDAWGHNAQRHGERAEERGDGSSRVLH